MSRIKVLPKADNRTLTFVGGILIACLLAMTMFVMEAKSAEKRQVVVIETMSLPFLQKATEWLRTGITELGYQDGEAVTYTILNAQGNFELAAAIEAQSSDIASVHRLMPEFEAAAIETIEWWRRQNDRDRPIRQSLL